MTRIKKLEELPGPFNKLIGQRMRELGMERLEQFAAYSELGDTTLYNLVLGRVSPSGSLVKPSFDTLLRLSIALSVPLADLVYMLAPEAPGAQLQEDKTPGVHKLDLEVAGWVGAGPAQNEQADLPPIVVEDRFARGKELRAFKVRGDSMAAGKRPIMDGDVVVVNVKDKGSNTASVVARLLDGAYVCKMLKDDRFGRMLQSRNPEHTNGTPSAIPIDEVAEIVGRVVRIIHDE